MPASHEGKLTHTGGTRRCGTPWSSQG